MMQYHLNGYDHRNPEGDISTQSATDLPDRVDVLIVGCGPAGLTLAAQLAAFGGISTRIIDQKTGPLEVGQADGVACRSMEMFEAFGFADRLKKEAYWVNESVFWRPDASQPDHISRSGRIQDVEDGLSDMPHVILNQARVHDFYLERMARATPALVPNYNWRLADLALTDDATHPVQVSLTGNEAPDTVVNARYVVGCDGARSAVRRALGYQLEGDSANVAWGVMDVLAVTDFPDIRFKCLIQSAAEGSIVVIPREGGYLVRLYIEMAQLQPGERAQQRDISAEQIIAKARRILHPYSLEVRDLAWWSVYEIGQRVCRSFDDLGNEAPEHKTPRVFIAGDACHTHSPKAGQGMNVSMADAFNLGWKLAHVLTDKAPASLLKTYSAERQAIAEELIEFDRDMARLISERSEEEGETASSEFQDYFIRHGRYTAGVEARYGASVLTGTGQHQALAAGYPVGKRFHSALVTRVADGRTIQLGHVMKADGRWRLVAFAPEEAVVGGAITALSTFLLDDVNSPLRRFTDSNDDLDSVIDCRVVFQQPHDAIETSEMPVAFLPSKGRFELIDYEKAFSARLVQRTLQPHPQQSDIFDLRGINRKTGCMLIVRPDQFVADVLPVDAFDSLASYFSQVLLEANR